MDRDLEQFYARPEDRPFAGQTNPEFQDRLRRAHAGVTEADCHFYHTLDLGGGRIVPGGWDLRGNERHYLGHVRFDGLRVLEFGAATGYLTFWMEQQGARVTALDLPPGHGPDLVPFSNIDLAAHSASGAVTARQVRNSWWFGHRELKSNASAVYADIYRLPADLGRFDVSTFGSILLHLRSPFHALQEAARVTDQALVVTDLLPDILYGDDGNHLVEFNPGREDANLVNWWRLSPGALTRMFQVLGFPHVDIHYFAQTYHPHHRPDAPAETRFMFTAVGQRAPGLLPRLDRTPEDEAMDRDVRTRVPVIGVEGYNEAHRRLQQAHAELGAIYRSWAWKLTKPLRVLGL